MESDQAYDQAVVRQYEVLRGLLVRGVLEGEYGAADLWRLAEHDVRVSRRCASTRAAETRSPRSLKACPPEVRPALRASA